MEERIYLFSGLMLLIAGTVGLLAIGCAGYGRTGDMMTGGMMGRGMMEGRGMMGDMMRNMDEIDRKTEFSSVGERIFYRGVNSKGEIIKNSQGMRGAGCAMCHGADAKGMQMMMMDVPQLRWDYLADPEGHVHPSGRNHPPFTESSFITCVIAGADPSGNKLYTMMPTWEMSGEDIDDLIQYLKTK